MEGLQQLQGRSHPWTANSCGRGSHNVIENDPLERITGCVVLCVCVIFSFLKPSRLLNSDQTCTVRLPDAAPASDTSSVSISSSELCRLLPLPCSRRCWAAVATQFLTVTLPSAANQLPASHSPSFKTQSLVQLPLSPPACGAVRGCDSSNAQRGTYSKGDWFYSIDLHSHAPRPSLPSSRCSHQAAPSPSPI